MDVGVALKVALSLIQNAALLALGTIGYCRLRPWLQTRLSSRSEFLLFGFMLGVMGVIIMLVPLSVSPGFQLDLRSATIAVSTLFGGVAAGVVTLCIVALGRIAIGGGGI